MSTGIYAQFILEKPEIEIMREVLLRCAQEAAWREDNRRVSNGEQVHLVAGLAMARKPSVDFSGYWQRHSAA